ncbi:MAG: hypothetical protein V4685_11510 [Bacteroidota bacterium]
MKGLHEFLVPYTISQIVAIAILIIAFKSTKWARIIFAAVFFLAFCMNMYLGIFAPDTYLDYAKFAIPFYRDFINGWFSRYNHIIVPAIACGQLLIAIGMLLKDWWVKWACIGSVIFLISISPLMVASAFPFSIIVSAAAMVILKNDNRNFGWLKKNIQPQPS